MIKQRNVLWFVLSQIDRKPVKDIESRNNFKEAIYDYIIDLESLEPINVIPSSPSYSQKEYLNKLLTLTDRWNSIGNESVPEPMLDSFLTKLQDMCRTYLHDNLDYQFKKERQIYYTKLVRNQQDTELAPPTRLNNLKELAHQRIGKNLG